MCIANMMQPLMDKMHPGFLGKLNIGQRLTAKAEDKAGYGMPRPIDQAPQAAAQVKSQPYAALQNLQITQRAQSAQ